MPISWRIGPLITAILVIEVVLLDLAVDSLAASARITGKYSGRAPAITAFTATFSTVYSQNSRNEVGRILPTTSSGEWLVPLSIAATRASVGNVIGKKSVQRLSVNVCRKFSSVSAGNSRGVERSNDTPLKSSAASAPVNPSTTSCIKGRPEVGSLPSM